MAALHLIHDAVQRGDLEIVSQRLALGASQMPNNRRLTPLLYACNHDWEYELSIGLWHWERWINNV